MEDPVPWSSSAQKGWRVEVLNPSQDHERFIVSVIELTLDEALEYECRVDTNSLNLRICLQGAGEIRSGDISQRILPNTINAVELKVGTSAGCYYEAGKHLLVNIRFSYWYLASIFENESNMRSSLSKTLTSKCLESERIFSLSEPVGKLPRSIAQSLSAPPITDAASSLWFRAKATELLAHWAFTEPEGSEAPFFCSRQKRVAIERVEKAKEYLLNNYAEPMNLTALARATSCSEHYLSRLFSKETGMTLSRYLRAVRIQKASELLETGKMNVTEAAFEVGYQSLSHFARAFRQEKGINPSHFNQG
ncbi:MAG: AraC family transcriptional regulator [Verrucomicrobiota bacterium]|nr:AraC family transcriptional regulator [Verrucomicrobiota bacterium]